MANDPGVHKFSLSKWVIALLVGIPVAAGAFYILRKPKNPALPDQNGICKAGKKKAEDKKEDSVESKKVEKELTPLEVALNLKNAGNACFKKGEYNEAIRCYTEAISVCPPSDKDHMSTLYQNRAATYESLGDTENVLKDCTNAINLNPRYLKALTRRYKAAERVKDMQQALEDVTAVCLLERFNNMETLGAADRILKVIGELQGREFVAKRLSEKTAVIPSSYFIKQYFASFTEDPVLKDLSKVASAEPVLLRGLDKARRALYDERFNDIVPACNEEIEKPSSIEAKEHALLLRATMMLLMNSEDSLTDLTYLIDNTKDTKIKAYALLRRSCIYMQQEEMEKAFHDFDEAAELDPTNADIPHQKAQMLLLADRLQEALQEFQKANSLNPTSLLVVVQKLYAEYRYGFTMKDENLVKKAEKQLGDIVAKGTSPLEGYMLLAQIYVDAQEYEKAESFYDAGIKSDPKNAAILVHKGLLYLQWKGDTKTASTLLEKAIEVDPKSEFAYETLASLEVQRGNLERAVELFDKAVPLAKSVREICHVLSLRAAALAQIVVAKNLNIDPSTGM